MFDKKLGITEILLNDIRKTVVVFFFINNIYCNIYSKPKGLIKRAYAVYMNISKIQMHTKIEHTRPITTCAQRELFWRPK